MNNIEEVWISLRIQGHVLETDSAGMMEKLKIKFNDFLKCLKQEDTAAQTAFRLMIQSVFYGRILTHEEKVEVENQLKEVLKTAGLVSLTLLPGGTLFFILAHFLKLNKYIIPSVFLKPESPAV